MTGETDIETERETDTESELARILNPSLAELVRMKIIERQKVSALKDLYKKEL